jgi:predicted nucleotidyltransferase
MAVGPGYNLPDDPPSGTQYRPEIASLCRKYGVRKLELFGSAASGQFDPASSDIDFFYEFDDDPTGLADRFFGLMEDLEKLLGRKVDLVSSQDVRNPYFLQVANRHRLTLWASSAAHFRLASEQRPAYTAKKI